jgi:hypothetical protein
MKYRINVLIIVLTALFCLLSYQAFAEDKTGNWNFNETTGLVNMPTARTLDYRSVKFSIGMAKLGEHPPLKHRWQAVNPGPFTGTPLDSDWWIDSDSDRRLLISPIRNVELGFMNYHSQELTPTCSAKWVAIPEKKNFPAIAIGIQNAFASKEDDGSSVYDPYPPDIQKYNSMRAPFIVASKYFGKNDMLDLTIGYGGGRFRNHVIYGGELFMDKKHLFSAVGEYNGNTYCYGLKYRFPKGRWNLGLVMQNTQPGFEFGYTMPW